MAKSKKTEDEISAEKITAFALAINEAAQEQDLDFSEIFHGLSRSLAAFTIEYNLLADGEATYENVIDTLARFFAVTEKAAKFGIEAMAENSQH